MNMTMFTTKDGNSSARLNTEILPLHAVQGQNDIKSSAFYFQSNDRIGRVSNPPLRFLVGA
jgi:hypothetical protein